VTRHWCALTEELKSALQRLESSSVSIDTALHAKILESFSILKVTYVFSRIRELAAIAQSGL
jgi:hypothetical protein